MPRSASTGVYTPPSNSFNPAVADTTISSTAWNGTAADYITALAHAPSSTRALYPTTGQVQDGAFQWGGTAGGTANARTITLTPAITAYAAGQRFAFINGAAANSSAATLAVNGLTAQNILRASGNPLVAGDLPASGIINVQYDGSAFRLAGVFSDAGPSANRGVIGGLVLSNNGTDATNDIDISEGVARSSDNTTDLLLVTGLTKQLDAAWAAGTNQGMRDTGSIANGTWHIFLINNPTSGVVDVLASLSATSPTLPSGFTKFRRIGSILRQSAAILPFTQLGNDFLLTTAIRDLNNVSSFGSSAVLRTLSVPSGINVIAMVRMTIGAGDPIKIASPSETLSALISNGADASLVGYASTTTDQTAGTFFVWTNTSSQVQTRQFGGGASTLLNIHTFGWTDLRGEFA